MEKTKSYANVSHPVLRWLFRSPFIVLAVQWLFQGLLYMDATERWFKVGFDVVCGFLLTTLLACIRFPLPWAVALSALTAHTINFLLNAHLWGGLKHYGLVRTKFSSFQAYLERLKVKVECEPSIGQALVYGSMIRGEWNEQSDVDVRLVRRPGLWNGWRACWFVMRERTWALLRRFPLDMYVFDTPSRLADMRSDEYPTRLK
jgi:hypothetical protein